jgi:hypothetical protein
MKTIVKNSLRLGLIILPKILLAEDNPFAGLESVGETGVEFLLTKVVGFVITVYLLFTFWGIKSGTKTMNDLIKVLAISACAAGAAVISDWIIEIAGS